MPNQASDRQNDQRSRATGPPGATCACQVAKRRSRIAGRARAGDREMCRGLAQLGLVGIRLVDLGWVR